MVAEFFITSLFWVISGIGVTSEQSCYETVTQAGAPGPSSLTSSRFMTHNKMRRLLAQHLAHACCKNEDMATALRSCAVILAWSQPITQFPEMAANRDTCWADLFWTSHASPARPPHQPLRGSEAQLQHGVDRRRSMPLCTHEDLMKTAICCRTCHTNSSTTEKAPCQPPCANIAMGKMGDPPNPSKRKDPKLEEAMCVSELPPCPPDGKCSIRKYGEGLTAPFPAFSVFTKHT